MSRRFFLRKFLGDRFFLDYDVKRFWTDRTGGRVDITNRWMDDFALLVRKEGVRSVFEVGCGTGANLACIRSSLPAVSLGGCDIVEWCVEKASKDFGLQGNVFVHDLRKPLPLGDGAVDCVLCITILMHIPPCDIEFVVSELKRVARKLIFICEEPDRGIGLRHPNNFVFYHDYDAVFGLQKVLCKSISGNLFIACYKKEVEKK